MFVNSIFNSVSGEVGIIPQGSLTTFVRLAGCNLKCPYCDAKKTWKKSNGVKMKPEQIARIIKTIGCPNVIITGGEPLLQTKELEILLKLIINDTIVQIETNGTITPSYKITDYSNCIVYDYKPIRIRRDYKFAGFDHSSMSKGDWIKFTVSNLVDYVEAKEFIIDHEFMIMHDEFKLAMSAILPLTSETLVRWLKMDKLWNVVVNHQIHKDIFKNKENENEFLDITSVKAKKQNRKGGKNNV